MIGPKLKKQEEFKTPEMIRPDYSYGYKDRPINQKRGIYNTYLDSISISVNSSTGTFPTVTLENGEISKIGNLNWKLSGNKLYPPISGTFLISINISETETNTATELSLGIIHNTLDVTRVYSINTSLNALLWGGGTGVVNVAKGEYIEIACLTNDAGGQIAIDITITKLS